MNSAVLSEKYKGKNCDVLGFGKSNRPLVGLLRDAGAHVTVRDKNAAVTDGEEAADYMRDGIRFVTGEGYLEGITGDFIFRSPGIRPDEPGILEAIERGAALDSEMELFFELAEIPVFGITGSDGKTTTTTLSYLFLEAEAVKQKRGKCYVGGNIGQPLLPNVFRMGEGDSAVVELSSFQLMTMKKSPFRAVITNITPNHLNWHTDMDEYIAAKCNIFMHKPASLLVTNAENGITYEIARNTDVPVIYFSSKRNSYSSIVPPYKSGCKAIYEDGGVIWIEDSDGREEIMKSSDILIPGRHNVENYMAAIGLTYGYVSKEIYSQVARSFKGVRHRLELIRELDGIKYYNSSIDSSPTRTAAAIGALDCKPVVICGGYDKNIPFDTLADTLCKKAKAVVLTGATADKILREIENCPAYDSENLEVELVRDFEAAVKTARSLASKGDVVLLSPACASFDAFSDFEERGDFFRKIVQSF